MSRRCNSIGTCNDCEETSGCSWLECTRDSSALSNVTTIVVNNATGLNSFYTYSSIPALEDIVDAWFQMASLRVFFITQEDFVALGASQGVFSGCIASSSVSDVSNQYDDSDVTCDVSTDCITVQNQLSAQVATISTSVGAAGGGSVGCFCGSCLIAVLYYRRKKKTVDTSALIERTDSTKSFVSSEAFEDAKDLVNPLFDLNDN